MVKAARNMEAYKKEFIQLALDVGALKFGEFELKSGRNSPYFFNSGMFAGGRAAAVLGRCYAAAAAEADGGLGAGADVGAGTGAGAGTGFALATGDAGRELDSSNSSS